MAAQERQLTEQELLSGLALSTFRLIAPVGIVRSHIGVFAVEAVLSPGSLLQIRQQEYLIYTSSN